MHSLLKIGEIMSIIFETNTELDLRALTTFGLSVKETENPIGYFGTGLKYAIAILLRNDHEINLYTGGVLYYIRCMDDIFRGVGFKKVTLLNSVTLEEKELPFTLELGKNWELWQSFRELYSNTLDEGGEIYRKEESFKYSPNKTFIEIIGEDFEKVFDNKEDYFLNSEPIYKDETLEVHKNVKGSRSVFYKGILVHTLYKTPFYRYNILRPTTLTEDRTLSTYYILDQVLSKFILNYSAPSFSKQIIIMKENSFEAELDYSWAENSINPALVDYYQTLPTLKVTNKSLLRLFLSKVKLDFKKSEVTLTEMQLKQLDKAKCFLKDVGLVESFEDVKINVCSELGEGVLGRVYENEIYLSKRVFQQGTKQVATTLFEEYLHLRHDYIDLTYKFQNYLFDVILSQAEEKLGELL